MFEELVVKLWEDGAISGEMHLGIGEEAITAGIVSQLKDGDAMALDHRGTPPLVMRGVDLLLLLREFLGLPDGLCGGSGGHMHLFSKLHLAASSGIVGASGPAAAGFAIAAQKLRPGTVSVAFFGEGAMNQGMLMEAMNLASAWMLPVLFICKDDGWAITTRSCSVTGGSLVERAAGFGMPANEVDGTEFEQVWQVAFEVIERARSGKGPAFILARCYHPEGHFLGDPFLRIMRHPVKEIRQRSGSLFKSVIKKNGGTFSERAGALGRASKAVSKARKDRHRHEYDPVKKTRKKLLGSDRARLLAVEKEVSQEMNNVLKAVLQDLKESEG